MSTTQERLETPEPAGDGHKKDHFIPTTPLGERSLGELFATLSRDLALLVHQEVELVKADLKLVATTTAAGVAGLVIAAIALVFAVPVLSIAASLGVHALGISLGFSFLIIGGAIVCCALPAAAFGILALRKVKPATRVVGSMKADLRAIARVPKPVRPGE